MPQSRAFRKKRIPDSGNGIESTIETAKIEEFVCWDMLKKSSCQSGDYSRISMTV